MIAMIVQLKKAKTQVSIINKIPKVFFSKIEASNSFGDHLFPGWANTAFVDTDLKKKFETVYKVYKSYKTDAYRKKIRSAFIYMNQVEELCDYKVGTEIITLSDLPSKIQEPISNLFNYLYNNAINYSAFEAHVKDSVRESIDRYIQTNSIEVCPFCGIEGYVNLSGQARLSLDHWLPKNRFPMAAVNFNNLIPIGTLCNMSPAKGRKNVLLDDNKIRVKAFYPFSSHAGIDISFSFLNEPTIDGVNDEDWTFKKSPKHPDDQEIFENWLSTMNIKERYKGYFRKNILKMWEEIYIKFIDEDPDLRHANSIDELKANFKHWRASFPIKYRPGSVLYRAFIDFLINNASDKFLDSLYQNFKRLSK